MTDLSDSGYDQVIEYVGENLEFEPQSYNDSYLKRRLKSRIRRTDVDGYRGYLKYVKNDPTEQDELLETLSVNVTSFFRNPEVWEVVREILSRETDEKYSVDCWSAACSDGREPYSIAMLSRDDRSISENTVSITATDIDEESLDKAESGVYESTRVVDIADELEPLDNVSNHIDVDEDGGSFEVMSNVKSMVDFKHHDLISGEPMGDYDIIFCRNLLIYINPEFKLEIFETLTNSLRSGGYLVIGRSETIPSEFRDKYDAYDRRNHIYQKK